MSKKPQELHVRLCRPQLESYILKLMAAVWKKEKEKKIEQLNNPFWLEGLQQTNSGVMYFE